jgi:long-chain acyl-CoA synthetase
MLSAANHPSWPIAFFGIQLAGATAVPMDAAIDAIPANNILRASRAKAFICDAKVEEATRKTLGEGVQWLNVHDAAAPGPSGEPSDVEPKDIAALIYTSGTTGTPKGVMLSHYNLTSLAASLAPLFPLGKDDRVLSVLPLHHTFELTCGLLLPLSRGSRVVYLDELTGERLEHGLAAGRITAMVGVPALWEMLERKIHAKVAEHGAVASRVFDFAVEVNRAIGKNAGVDAGRLLFGPVHKGLGGHLRYLVSGGAALPQDTHERFAGLGLHLTEGYGLTEAAPVLAVASSGPGAKGGHVGRAIPGVELRVHEPNKEGVGEILARGPNVMVGYADNEEETRSTIDAAGWLHTGDLGKLDRRGNLTIVGRAKDTVVTSNGENVYPDDVEARLGSIDRIEEYVVLGVSDPRGGERIACVAVPKADDTVSRPERHAAAKAAMDKALARLPNGMRPVVTLLIDVPLPRTATRKVKRAEVRRLVERVTAPLPQEAVADDGRLPGAARLVRAAISAIARKSPSEVAPAMTLRGDLGLDSLMLLELLVALEGQVKDAIDADRLSACETVADVEALLQDTGAARRLARATPAPEDDEAAPLELPPALRSAAMHWLGRRQMGFYRSFMRTRVTGKAFIPHNRNSLVVANHSSHLDMGLVKYALGDYGQGMTSLAAQDYFFEGGKWRKAYFENLTNLVPISRTGSLRQSLRLAGSLIDEGKVVLLFPEGTRSPDGGIHEFKATVGHLALAHKVDVLPVWLGGTFQALPKGAAVIQSRNLTVRIGPPLEYEELVRLTKGMSPSESSKAVARLTRKAVVALSRGGVLDTRTLSPDDLAPEDEESMADLFRELEHRFLKGSVTDPVSFYFALGKTERWTVKVTSSRCEVVAGKGTDAADCVLKTSPAMFTRIVREAYTPTPGEFISGTVKSNNIALLMTFQKVFQLAGEER